MAIGLAWGIKTASAEILADEFIPLEMEYPIECDGQVVDVVALTGTLHILQYKTPDAAGGVHLKLQFNPAGVTGTGLLTGDTYHGVGMTTWWNDNVQADGSRVYSFVNQFGLVSEGTGFKYFESQVLHVLLDGEGNVQIEVEVDSITCR